MLAGIERRTAKAGMWSGETLVVFSKGYQVVGQQVSVQDLKGLLTCIPDGLSINRKTPMIRINRDDEPSG